MGNPCRTSSYGNDEALGSRVAHNHTFGCLLFGSARAGCIGCFLCLRLSFSFSLFGIKQRHHLIRCPGIHQGFDEVAFNKQPRQRSQCAHVHIPRSLRCGNHEEQLCRLFVQRGKVYARCTFGKYNSRFVDSSGFGMRHGDSPADTGAGLRFALQDLLLE
ncbi:hypothetical protein D3C87_1525540 [compost metagenome]